NPDRVALNVVMWKPNVAAERQHWALLRNRFAVLFTTPSLYFYLVPSYFCLVLKCPTCGKPVEWKDNPWRPFCSERCKQIDFGRWTSDEYRVPGRSINPAEMPEPHSEPDVDNEDKEP